MGWPDVATDSCVVSLSMGLSFGIAHLRCASPPKEISRVLCLVLDFAPGVRYRLALEYQRHCSLNISEWAVVHFLGQLEMKLSEEISQPRLAHLSSGGVMSHRGQLEMRSCEWKDLPRYCHGLWRVSTRFETGIASSITYSFFSSCCSAAVQAHRPGVYRRSTVSLVGCYARYLVCAGTSIDLVSLIRARL